MIATGSKRIVVNVIKAAAVRHRETGEVVEGVHHGDAMMQATGKSFHTLGYDSPWEEGFTTDTGDFLDREQALDHARKSDQVAAKPRISGLRELVSENLKGWKGY